MISMAHIHSLTNTVSLKYAIDRTLFSQTEGKQEITFYRIIDIVDKYAIHTHRVYKI